MQSKNITIILTGTINVNAIFTNHDNANLRRLEYLNSLKYYSQFAKIYFLENSGYNFSLDKEFINIPNTTFYEHPKSANYSRGKGYQEFEMIDSWLNGMESRPNNFIKITGRYIVKNISDIISECSDVKDHEIIIEKFYFKKNIALTDIFYVTYDYYRNNIYGKYINSDDASGIYIEHIIRSVIDNAGRNKVFRHFPLKIGISGSTGRNLGNLYILKMINFLRYIVYIFNKKSRFF